VFANRLQATAPILDSTSRTHAQLLRPKLAEIVIPIRGSPSGLRKAFDRDDQEIKRCCEEARLAA